MNEKEIIKTKLVNDYDSYLVTEILNQYKSIDKLKHDLSFIRQRLYTFQKDHFLPDWILGLEYKDFLLETHDLIIEECTGYSGYKLHFTLLKHLKDNYEKGIPLEVQLRFFQDMKFKHSYKMDDIIACFNESFVIACREIYKKHQNFEKNWQKKEIGIKLKSEKNITKKEIENLKNKIGVKI